MILPGATAARLVLGGDASRVKPGATDIHPETDIYRQFWHRQSWIGGNRRVIRNLVSSTMF
jgi:hypothetical protein